MRNQYLTKLVFNIDIDHGNHNRQFDEQWRIIRAGTVEEAYAKAFELGRHEEEHFINAANKLVQWKFIGVPEICALDAMEDGDKISSTTHVTCEPGDYSKLVEHKVAMVRNKFKVFV
jgi:hypothetical protein